MRITHEYPDIDHLLQVLFAGVLMLMNGSWAAWMFGRRAWGDGDPSRGSIHTEVRMSASETAERLSLDGIEVWTNTQERFRGGCH